MALTIRYVCTYYMSKLSYCVGFTACSYEYNKKGIYKVSKKEHLNTLYHAANSKSGMK